jgi:hypothetical protein
MNTWKSIQADSRKSLAGRKGMIAEHIRNTARESLG